MPHDPAVVLERGVVVAEPLRLDEVEVGEPGVEHQPDRVPVQPGGDQGAVVRRRVGDRGLGGVSDVDDDRPRRVPLEALAVGVSSDHDDAVADQQELGPLDRGQVHRLEELRPAPGHVVGDEVVALDPDQEGAVGLDHVGLVDPGLLHVGPGLARGGCVRRGRRCGGIASYVAIGRGRQLHVAGRHGVHPHLHRVVGEVPAVRPDSLEATLDVPVEQLVARRGGGEIRVGEGERAGRRGPPGFAGIPARDRRRRPRRCPRRTTPPARPSLRTPSRPSCSLASRPLVVRWSCWLVCR